MLLWQPQKGKKQGVRWYDFGGSKKQAEAMGMDSGLDLMKIHENPIMTIQGCLQKSLHLLESLPHQEFASSCACRKFAKETYGLFGCVTCH